MNTSELTEAAIESKEQLVANLRRVIADAEELLAATAGQTDSKMADLRARAKENLAIARDKLADVSAAGRDRARQAAEATDQYVHDNPWSSIGAAAAVGMLIGVLLGRR
jgi:ElaB/YqjD/DUF883 family membrane-anchored ribosome-binding protein